MLLFLTLVINNFIVLKTHDLILSMKLSFYQRMCKAFLTEKNKQTYVPSIRKIPDIHETEAG